MFTFIAQKYAFGAAKRGKTTHLFWNLQVTLLKM